MKLLSFHVSHLTTILMINSNSQNIEEPWYDLHGECPFVIYICVPSRQAASEKPRLGICMCPIWEYQKMYIMTCANENLRRCMDFAWSGAIIGLRWTDLYKNEKYCAMYKRHKDFSEFRLKYCTEELKPKDALSRGIEAIDKIKGFESFNEVRLKWCPAPEELTNEHNWLPYDDDFFKNNTSWPKIGTETGIPNIFYY